jgi:undecaprenyl-diphosphatase
MGRTEIIGRTIAGTMTLATLLAVLISAAVGAGRAIMGPWQVSAYALDYSIALRVHSIRSPAMDAVMGFFSGIGEMLPMALITFALFVGLLLCGRYRSALCCALSLPGTALMWKFTSLLVLRERPNYWIQHDSIDFGYPCGHIMNAVVVAGFCLYAAGAWNRPRRQRTGMLLFWTVIVIGTGLARIYVNAHYFTDDIAGFLMGLVWIVLALPVLQWGFPGCRDRQRAASPDWSTAFAGRASGLSRMMGEYWRRRGIPAGDAPYDEGEDALGSHPTPESQAGEGDEVPMPDGTLTRGPIPPPPALHHLGVSHSIRGGGAHRTL